MNVATRELCQRLHKLSGWEDCYMLYWNRPNHKPAWLLYPLWYIEQEVGVSKKWSPAYDLGYLWRKFEDLGNDINVGFHDSSCNMTFAYGQRGTASLLEGFGHRVEVEPNDTVEDYFCEFFIKLFEQGELKK
jgi:hypothetical protein